MDVKKEKISLGKKIVRGMYKGLIWIVNKVLRVKVVNKENIPKNRPILITPNHVNKLDAVLLLNLCSDNIVFLAKEEMAKNIIGKSMVWAFDIVLVNRASVEISSMKNILKALKQNQKVAIFPEGTRDGMLKGRKLKTGAVFLSLKSGVNILPIGLNGSYRPFAKDNKVIVGEEIDFSKMLKEGKTEKDKDELERLTEILRDKILELIEDGRYDSIKI